LIEDTVRVSIFSIITIFFIGLSFSSFITSISSIEDTVDHFDHQSFVLFIHHFNLFDRRYCWSLRSSVFHSLCSSLQSLQSKIPIDDVLISSIITFFPSVFCSFIISNHLFCSFVFVNYRVSCHSPAFVVPVEYDINTSGPSFLLSSNLLCLWTSSVCCSDHVCIC
jgi:hypothetical protein